MNLSKNFTVAELIKSNTASRLGIDNTPSADVLNNLQVLAFKVLQPVRDHFDAPITVSSGYRSPKLNKAVKGSKTSQHVTGQAADIEIYNVPNEELFNWIKDNLQFDQLILEFYNPADPSSGWVHVSYNEQDNRNMYFSIDS